MHRIRLRPSPVFFAVVSLTATLLLSLLLVVAPAHAVNENVTGRFGWWRRTASLDGLGGILPADAQSAAATLDGVPPIGPLWVTVDIVEVTSDGQDVMALTEVTPRTVVVWAIPWILIALLALAAVIAILRRRRRARRLAEVLPAADDTTSNETGSAAPAEQPDPAGRAF
jgi:hypothetical protein